MKKLINYACLTIIIMLLIFPYDIYAQCPTTSTTNDDLVWTKRNDTDEYVDSFNDYFKSELELHEVDWDGGWGWHKLWDHTRAYSKMYTAALMLYIGVGSYYNNWNFKRISGGSNFSRYLVDSKPILSFDTSGNAHVFLRDSTGRLFHAYYNPYLENPNSSRLVENISNLTPINGDIPEFTGELIMFREPLEGRIQILGMPGDDLGPIFLFEQTSDNPTGDWNSILLSPDITDQPVGYSTQFFLMHNPVVIQDPASGIHIFGVNSSGEIIQYLFRDDFEIYGRSALEKSTFEWTFSTNKEAMDAILDETGMLHVIAIENSTKSLVHFYFKNGQWKSLNITEAVGREFEIDSLSTIVVQNPSNNNISVFVRNHQGDLLHYYLKSGYFGCTNAWEWNAENITENAQNFSSPDHDILHRPVRVEPSFSSFSHYQIFGYDYREDFVYFRKSASEWQQIYHILDDYPDSYYEYSERCVIETEPQGIKGPGSLQHVFGVDREGHLAHYEKSESSLSWNIYQVSFPSTFTFRLRNSPICIKDHPNGDRHIVGLDRNSSKLIHIYNRESHAWHSSDDYWNWASGNTHEADFHYEPKEQWEKNGHRVCGYAYCGVIREDRVEMWCPSFDTDYGPARRAAIMLHEATHIKLGGTFDVRNGDHDPKDTWFHHTLNDIPFGELNPNNSDHEHSMYQIQAEFLSDIAEFPADWVPQGVITSAKSTANWTIDHRFSNDPGWKVGEPRPLQ